MEPLWVALGQLWTQLRVKATQPSGSINVIRANPLTIALIEGWATTLSKFADTGGSVVAEAFVARPRRQAWHLLVACVGLAGTCDISSPLFSIASVLWSQRGTCRSALSPAIGSFGIAAQKART
jgi:hypothetical protein